MYSLMKLTNEENHDGDTQPYVNKRSIVIHIGSYSKMLIFKSNHTRVKEPL